MQQLQQLTGEALVLSAELEEARSAAAEVRRRRRCRAPRGACLAAWVAHGRAERLRTGRQGFSVLLAGS